MSVVAVDDASAAAVALSRPGVSVPRPPCSLVARVTKEGRS